MPELRFLVFDLDETLYPPHTGLFHDIGRRIHQYLEGLGFAPEEVPEVRHRYYQRYGTTLRGLQLHHQVDTDDYLAYVHDVDVAAYLRPNPELDAMLGRLEYAKVIFTNATAEYAWRVLGVLGIERHFQRVLDIYALRFLCKPAPEAYEILLQELAAQGAECLLIEDNPRNVLAGKAVGMRTVLVRPEPGPHNGADWTVSEVTLVEEIVTGIGNHEQTGHAPVQGRP